MIHSNTKLIVTDSPFFNLEWGNLQILPSLNHQEYTFKLWETYKYQIQIGNYLRMLTSLTTTSNIHR